MKIKRNNLPLKKNIKENTKKNKKQNIIKAKDIVKSWNISAEILKTITGVQFMAHSVTKGTENVYMYQKLIINNLLHNS